MLENSEKMFQIMFFFFSWTKSQLARKHISVDALFLMLNDYAEKNNDLFYTKMDFLFFFTQV